MTNLMCSFEQAVFFRTLNYITELCYEVCLLDEANLFMHMNCVSLQYKKLCTCNIFFRGYNKQSQYWPHLFFITNVHKGGLKHHQPCLYLKACYPITAVLVIKVNQPGEPIHTIAKITWTE